MTSMAVFPQISLVFVALLVLMSIPMTILVGLRRAKTGILLLHGDDDDLLRRMRAHGNFIEYVPLALIALAGAEIAGTPSWAILACGSTLLVARVVHYLSLRRSASSPGRAIGALLTVLVMFALSVAILLALSGGI